MSSGLDMEFVFMNKDLEIAYFNVTEECSIQKINIISILAELPE